MIAGFEFVTIEIYVHMKYRDFWVYARVAAPAIFALAAIPALAQKSYDPGASDT